MAPRTTATTLPSPETPPHVLSYDTVAAAERERADERMRRQCPWKQAMYPEDVTCREVAQISLDDLKAQLVTKAKDHLMSPEEAMSLSCHVWRRRRPKTFRLHDVERASRLYNLHPLRKMIASRQSSS